MQTLVGSLQSQIANAKLSAKNISVAIEQLRTLGHSVYDEDKFPILRSGHDYSATSTSFEDLTSHNSPINLAEAMLWKLGRWGAYKSFVRNYEKADLVVSAEGGVVMAAFARHLQDSDHPIYDQHAIRSLWAIAPLDGDERSACESLLIDGSGKWKESGSGAHAVTCYELFVKHTKQICVDNEVSLRELDLLLMPLGQALKREARGSGKTETDLQVFKAICGLH